MRAVIPLLLLVALVACVDETPDVSDQPARRTMSGEPPRTETQPLDAATSDFPGNRPGGIATAQERVELNEYAIRMPQDLKAGAQSFFVVNSGKETHSLEIEGNGVELRLPADLARGDDASLDVNLKPGTYTVYCPVDGHRQKGMETKITVK